MLKALKKRLKDQRGLTLIELLAVVVILGIIAAIAVPNIMGVINGAERKATVAEGVQIINAAKLYTTTNKPVFNTDTPPVAVINETQLTTYLENIKDTDGYDVTITDNGGGKYSYKLSDHASVDIANPGTATGTKYATEAQLISASK